MNRRTLLKALACAPAAPAVAEALPAATPFTVRDALKCRERMKEWGEAELAAKRLGEQYSAYVDREVVQLFRDLTMVDEWKPYTSKGTTITWHPPVRWEK